jgi:hypothetical protein
VTQNRQLGIVLMALAIVAALVTWWLSRPVPEKAAARISSAAQDESPVAEAAVTRPREEATGAATRPAVPVVCRDQSLDITVDEEAPRTACLGKTRTIANGSVRTHRVEAQGRDVPTVMVDTGDGAVLRVELVYPDGGKFSCLRDKCGGVSMGAYDTQGARPIRFSGAKLTRGERTASITGTLRTMPDDQVSGTTCVGQLLYISVGEGTLHFCPDSGSGFQMRPDGSIAYRFMNGDGKKVGIRVGRDDAVQAVEYDSFTCQMPNCSGVRVARIGTDEQRSFTFQGTVLAEQGAGAASVILNGNLILAPQ